MPSAVIPDDFRKAIYRKLITTGVVAPNSDLSGIATGLALHSAVVQLVTALLQNSASQALIRPDAQQRLRCLKWRLMAQYGSLDPMDRYHTGRLHVSLMVCSMERHVCGLRPRPPLSGIATRHGAQPVEPVFAS